jgi:hypothetical protein
MAGKIWSDYEINYLKDNFEEKTCEEIAKDLQRSIRSTQHKFGELKLKRRKAKLGDIVNGWEIIDIYSKQDGAQMVTYAKIKSTLGDNIEREEKLTRLTLVQIGWPDRRRPDVTLKNTTHGLSKTRLYSIWGGMKTRCDNSKAILYDCYGGRGIKICDEWLIFENFRDWSLLNGYNEKLTIDRINVDGNYNPDNCRWSDNITQTENKRSSIKLDITAFGETKSIYRWLHDKRCVVKFMSLKYRINAGWEPEIAITKPSERKSKQKCDDWLKENYPEIYNEYLIS